MAEKIEIVRLDAEGAVAETLHDATAAGWSAARTEFAKLRHGAPGTAANAEGGCLELRVGGVSKMSTRAVAKGKKRPAAKDKKPAPKKKQAAPAEAAKPKKKKTKKKNAAPAEAAAPAASSPARRAAPSPRRSPGRAGRAPAPAYDDGQSGDGSEFEKESSSESEEEEEVVSEEEEPVEEEVPKKRKASSKNPAPKKARTEHTIEEHEKGTTSKPTEGTITSSGAFAGEFAFALGTVCSVLCEKTARWVPGHVIMFHRGGVTTRYAVHSVRVLFEKAQNVGKTHYQDCDVTSEKEADKRLVRLDLPKREVRLWTSGSPCMRNVDLGYAAASKEKPLDKAVGFGASKEYAAKAASKTSFSYGGKGSDGLERAEREASKRLKEKPTKQDVKACLALLQGSWPTQERPNVTPDGKAVQGMCLGAVFVLGGGGMCVSQISSAYPALCKLITKWVHTSLPEDFPFSSLQINYNYAAKKHVDGNNIGPSYIRSLGDHTGGELWTADAFVEAVDEDTGEKFVKGGGGPTVLGCSDGWKLFNGNAEHYTKPYTGTRISFIAFSHNAYNKLSTRVASKLKALGFTAASDDGVDLPYFAKYRIDKSEFTPDENSKYFAYQKQRAVELPPPVKPNRLSIECYGLTMARGGGWVGYCDGTGKQKVHELTPNMTGFHVLELDVSATKGIQLKNAFTDRNRFDIYGKTEVQVDRFAKFVQKLPKGRVVAIAITDTAVAAKRPPGDRLYDALRLLGGPQQMEKIGYRFPFAFLGVKGGAEGSALLMMDKTKFLLRIDATLSKEGDSVAFTEVKTERTDVTAKVILAGKKK